MAGLAQAASMSGYGMIAQMPYTLRPYTLHRQPYVRYPTAQVLLMWRSHLTRPPVHATIGVRAVGSPALEERRAFGTSPDVAGELRGQRRADDQRTIRIGSPTGVIKGQSSAACQAGMRPYKQS